MATAKTLPFASVRDSVARAQRQGERVVAQLRRDAGSLVARGRSEVSKELRDFERSLLKALHAATTEQVGRLERRVAALEEAFAKLDRGPGTGP